MFLQKKIIVNATTIIIFFPLLQFQRRKINSNNLQKQMLKFICLVIALVHVGRVVGVCSASSSTPQNGFSNSPLETRWTQYYDCVIDPTKPPGAFFASPVPDIVGLTTYINNVSGLDPGTFNNGLDIPDWIFFGQVAPAQTFPNIVLNITRVTVNVPSDNAPDVDLYIYRPNGVSGLLSAFVYFHPGAFQVLRAIHFDNWARKIVQTTNAVVVLVDFNNTRALGAENPFPAASLQGARALRYLRNQGASIGINASRLTVMGESAGGQIAVSSILRARDQGIFVEKCILGSPFLDVESRTVPVVNAISLSHVYSRKQITDSWAIYAGGNLRNLRDNLYFNVFNLFLQQNFTGLPRFLTIGAGDDPLRQEAETFALLLRNAGVDSTYFELARATHTAWLYDKIYPTESRLVLGLIRSF